MNRNQMIGTFIGRTAGYLIQGVAFSKIAESVNPQSAVLLRVGAKYSIKLAQYSSKKHIRTDFNHETVFSDAIDASFDAY